MEAKLENDIHCHECKNNTFRLNESDMNSLNVVCTKCGAILTLRANLTVRGVIRYLKTKTDAY